MLGWQIGVILFLFIVFSAVLMRVFRKFGIGIRTVLPLLAPLLTFSIGFGLRLSGKSYLVDLGFFLTDFSTLFVSVLFTAFLFFGQLKYWKK